MNQLRLFRDFDLFSEFLQSQRPLFKKEWQKPLSVHLVEKETAYEITAELPEGIRKEHLQIDLEQGILSIEVKKTYERKEDGRTLLDERQDYHAKRQFDFGQTLQEDNHKVLFNDQVLKITLQKRVSALPVKKTLAID
jgi:HSP20 family protein